MADEIIPGIGSENAPVNPGELLHAERLRVGFTTEEVATHLRLSKTTLGFLEEGKFDRLPGDTFARGYIRAYARLLKLDPNRLVLEYDRYVGIGMRESEVNTINRVNTAARRGPRLAMILTTVAVIAIMVLLGLWWWNESRETPSQTQTSGTAQLQDADEVQVDSMLFTDELARPDEELDDVSAEVIVDSIEQDEAQAADTLTPSLPTDEQPAENTTVSADGQPAAIPAEQSTDAATEQSGLVMSFTDSCWVQVSGPGGKILHSGQLHQGDSLNIDQPGPLELVVGAAAAVSKIEYNGKPVELKVNRQSGVARLRLGQ